MSSSLWGSPIRRVILRAVPSLTARERVLRIFEKSLICSSLDLGVRNLAMYGIMLSKHTSLDASDDSIPAITANDSIAESRFLIEPSLGKCTSLLPRLKEPA